MSQLSMSILYENGKVILKGPFSQAQIRNRNGRIYPHNILREAIQDLIKRVEAQPQTVYSELEHPNYAEIKPEKACGLLTEVTWDEPTGIAYCKVEILDSTPFGREVLRNLQKGETYGISTRALGTLNEDKVVQPGLKIITGDIVKTPSCQICSLNESESNTLDDFFVDLNESDCGCKFKSMPIDVQVQVKQHVVDAISNLFK